MPLFFPLGGRVVHMVLAVGIPKWYVVPGRSPLATDPTWIGSKKGREGNEFGGIVYIYIYIVCVCMELYIYMYTYPRQQFLVT